MFPFYGNAFHGDDFLASFVIGGPECPESDKTTGENGLDNRSGSSYKLNTNS